MAHRIYIGVDNGTTGSIACIGDCVTQYVETPILKEQSYTKARKIISRVDHLALKTWLMNLSATARVGASDMVAVIERPMINPMRFQASISAARSLEATLCIFEDFSIPHMYADSRDWQKVMLPKGLKGAPELKQASMDIGLRLFPDQEKVIKKHKDADALLIAEWARRAQL